MPSIKTMPDRKADCSAAACGVLKPTIVVHGPALPKHERATARKTQKIRLRLVQRIRREIAEGTYLTRPKLDVASARLVEALLDGLNHPRQARA